MKQMFSYCESLKILPDISKWKTNNAIDMNGLFENCITLEVLPDISKWNVDNVKDMSYMFSKCSSLKSLPNISIWNPKNAEHIEYIFNEVNILTYPDISKWEIHKLKNIENISSISSSDNYSEVINKNDESPFLSDISNEKDIDFKKKLNNDNKFMIYEFNELENDNSLDNYYENFYN